MLRKKQLTIETDFFEDTLQEIPHAIMISPIYHQQHSQQSHQQQDFIKSGLNEDDDCLITAAQIIQRLLTTKLIENFMHGWHTLKNNITQNPTQIQRVLSSVQRISSHQSYIKCTETDDFFKKTYERMSSQGAEVHSSKIQWLQERKQISCNLNLTDSYLERTRIIKEIVDKLRRGREEVQKLSYSLDRVSDSYYVHEHISRLEKVAQQLQIERLHFHKQHQNKLHFGENSQEKQVIQENDQENDIEARLWNEITQLRNELKELRFESEEIHQRQLHINTLKKIDPQSSIVKECHLDQEREDEEIMKNKSETTKSKLAHSKQVDEHLQRRVAEKQQLKQQFQLRSEIQHRQLHREIELLKKTQTMQNEYIQLVLSNQQHPIQTHPEVIDHPQIPTKLLYSVDIQTDIVKSQQVNTHHRYGVSQEIQTSNSASKSLVANSRSKEISHSFSIQVSPSPQVNKIQKLHNLQSLQFKANHKQFGNYLDYESTGRSETKTNELAERNKQKILSIQNTVHFPIHSSHPQSILIRQKDHQKQYQPNEIVETQANLSETFSLISHELAQMRASQRQLLAALQQKKAESLQISNQMNLAQKKEEQQFRVRCKVEIQELQHKIKTLELQQNQALRDQQQSQVQIEWMRAEQQLQEERRQEMQQEKQYQLLTQKQQNALQAHLLHETQLREALTRELEFKDKLLQQQIQKGIIQSHQVVKEQQWRELVDLTQKKESDQRIRALQEEYQILQKGSQYQIQLKEALIQQQQKDLSKLQQQLTQMHNSYPTQHDKQQLREAFKQKKLQSRPLLDTNRAGQYEMRNMVQNSNIGQAWHFQPNTIHSTVGLQSNSRSTQLHQQIHRRTVIQPHTAQKSSQQQTAQQSSQQQNAQQSSQQQTAQTINVAPSHSQLFRLQNTNENYQNIRLQQSKVYPVNTQLTTPATLKATFSTQRTTYATAPLHFSSQKRVISGDVMGAKAEPSLSRRDCTETKSKMMYWPRQEQNSQNCACCF